MVAPPLEKDHFLQSLFFSTCNPAQESNHRCKGESGRGDLLGSIPGTTLGEAEISLQ